MPIVRKIIPLALLATLVLGCATSEQPPISAQPLLPMAVVSSQTPQQYTVVKGDTLWDISSRFLNEPWRWPEIWINNPQVKNPHLIYPGDVVAIEWINGRPRWRINSQGARQARPVSALPIRAIQKHFQDSVFWDANQFDSAPYIAGIADGRNMAATGMEVYAANWSAADANNESGRYLAVRKGQAYRDPATGQLLGYEAIRLAGLTLRQPGDPAVLRVTENLREVKVGDRIVSVPANNLVNSLTPVKSVAVQGQVAAVFAAADMAGLHSVITVNRGSANGLGLGQVLRIAEETAAFTDEETDATLKAPNREIAQGLVFYLADRYAQVLLLKATREVRVGDIVLGTDE